MAHRLSLVLVLVLSCVAVSVQGFNITAILESYPNYSLFNQWLSVTGVANEVNGRTTITVLASSNSVLQSYLDGIQADITRPQLVADTLRYQILLTYYGPSQLSQLPLNNATSVTTLLQTTGRTNDTGFVDIYNTGTKILLGHHIVDKYGNETVIGNVTVHPYDYSILEISSVLIPLPTFLPAPLSAPSLAPAPTPGLAPGSTTPTVPKKSPPGSTVNYASMTSVRLPLTILALFVASIPVLL